MPHVLVAGTTGSGKSGCINAILSSILLHASPNEARLVLVDPKRVELNHYERLPAPADARGHQPAAGGQRAREPDRRDGEPLRGDGRGQDAQPGRAEPGPAKKAGEPPLPHILCVIDELADLMMVAPAEVEDSIIRLAQKSRAVGIHLVLATQRPSTDVITGTIKVNIPARIAFSVASQVDSRVILDQGGAETLLGQGDMLFRPVGTSRLQRIQGAFVTEDEIARVVADGPSRASPSSTRRCSRSRGAEHERRARGRPLTRPGRPARRGGAHRRPESRPHPFRCSSAACASATRGPGRLIDMLERRGIISGYEGSKPRQVLVSEAELPRLLERLAGGSGSDDRPADGDGRRGGQARAR